MIDFSVLCYKSISKKRIVDKPQYLHRILLFEEKIYKTISESDVQQKAAKSWCNSWVNSIILNEKYSKFIDLKSPKIYFSNAMKYSTNSKNSYYVPLR